MSMEHGMSKGLCVPSPGIITAKLQDKAGSLEPDTTDKNNLYGPTQEAMKNNKGNR